MQEAPLHKLKEQLKEKCKACDLTFREDMKFQDLYKSLIEGVLASEE